ncbi:MAG: glycosyltransferase [Rhodobacteraceae bacterium]|nr:glycosyltransferase [Paracoccaceae bacterium]
MHITHVTPSLDLSGGGVAAVVQTLAQQQSAIGLSAEVQTRRLRPNRARDIAAGSLRVMHMHGLWDPMFPKAALEAALSGTPYVVSPHGMLEAADLAKSPRKKRIALATYQGQILRRATCLHALTEAEAHDIRQVFPRAKIAVIPNGIRLSNIKNRAECSEKYILYLGRLNRKKGLTELISGFAQWATSNTQAPCWTLKIAGWDEGGHLLELKKQVATEGLNSRVHFLGPITGEAKSALLTGAAALALTSHSEGLPLAILEAWAHGLPVILSPACNIEPEGAGIMATPDPDAIAAALASLADLPPEARAAMGAKGRHLVAERYGIEAISRQFRDLYHWIAGQGPCPDFVTLPPGRSVPPTVEPHPEPARSP